MGILSFLAAKFYPTVFIPSLPMSREKYLEYAVFEQTGEEKNEEYTKLTGKSDGDHITLFLIDGNVHGIRYDFGFSKQSIKGILNRSARKHRHAIPKVLMDVDLTYVAELGGNRITVSGYTGSLGIWTKELHALISAPKKDRIQEEYQDKPGYSGHWELRNDEKVTSGTIEIYSKRGDVETRLATGSHLDNLNVSLVLFRNDPNWAVKIIQDGQVVQEIPIAGFAFSEGEHWGTQGAVYRVNDLYVLWHTSIIDFKNAFGYKILVRPTSG